MGGIANLVETAFAGQLDATGLRMLREMRAFGRAGWVGWALGRFLLPPAANPEGFVWIEDGKVIGNASLLPVDGRPERWVMANVAVLPGYRRRGIARAMVRAGLNLSAERGARLVVLQVKSDNQGARTLYESLGFQTLSTRTTWVRPPGPLPPPVEVVGRVRRRHPADWVAQWALAQRTHPEGLFWPYPLNAAYFRPSGLPAGIDWEGKRHWVWQEADDIEASLTAQPRAEERGWRLALLVDVGARGRAEAALLMNALRELPSDMHLILEYPKGVSESVFWVQGFRPDRSLTWMSIELGPRFASSQVSPQPRHGERDR
jgi:ribosomal protein S18 acetylase RimI-like enzyme